MSAAPGAARPWRSLFQVVAALAVLFALDRGADHLARRWVLADLAASAGAAAELRGAVLQAEIEKQRSLPLILAQDPDLREALAAPSPARLEALNAKLEALAQGTRTAVIYALDRTGVALAASNWRTGTSFVGSDYAFRPYFRDALREGAAEHFALGTVSNRPGLYGAAAGRAGRAGRRHRRQGGVRGGGGSRRRLPGPVLATDPRGIVTVTSVPAGTSWPPGRWRGRSTRRSARACNSAMRRSATSASRRWPAMPRCAACRPAPGRRTARPCPSPAPCPAPAGR
ncbi:hypothetical protein [Teichococcus aestuarii]|uniref:hypothetical protein n=1 Tax=Teichococcus aestuarii TaxID=568898 RepID=UPI00360F4DF8